MMISHDCGKMIVMHMLSVMSFPVEKNKNDNKLVIHVNNRSPGMELYFNPNYSL